MIVSELIDKILGDMGNPLNGSGQWTRPEVLATLSNIQREISRDTRNIYAETATISPAASATEITIDANGNYLEAVNAYRTYDSVTREIFVYTHRQIADYDAAWKTREGSMIRGIITDIAAEGKAIPYPMPDNADNDLVIGYIKLATRLTAELTEAGDASNQVSNWLIQGITSSNTATGYILYWELSNVTTTRTVKLYKSTTKSAANLVAQGSRTGDGSVTLTEQSNSGISGTVTVAFTVDDTETANTLTFATVEIPEADVPCLEYGTKGYLYNLERDGKDVNKGNFWKGLYESELVAALRRANRRREGTFRVIQERQDAEGSLRTRPLYPWEV